MCLNLFPSYDRMVWVMMMKKVLFVIDTEPQDVEKVMNCGCDVRMKDKKDVTSEDIEWADAVVGNVNPALVENSDIEWMHLESAGTDKYRNLKESILVTNSTGAYGKAISEHMLAGVFYFYKRLNQYVAAQPYHQWKNLGSVDSVRESKTLVLGMGDIGSQFAEDMHNLGSTIYGVRRRSAEGPSFVEKMYTFDTMDEIIGECDIIALCLPDTEETRNIIHLERLQKMKKSAVLINIGRGSAINTIDLMKVLDEGWFKGVLLDVTNPEPLPINHRLWNYDNVVITPHVSGNYNMHYTYECVIDIAVNNMKHFAKGETLEKIVDRQHWYTK